VGSRVRIVTAACLVASGLLAGGASASMAFADSPRIGDDSGGHTSGEKPKPKPDEKDATPGVGQQPGRMASEHPGNPKNHKDYQSSNDSGDPKPGDEKQGADDTKNGDNNRGDNNHGDNNPGDNNHPDEPLPTKWTPTPPTEGPPPPPPHDPNECDGTHSPGWPWPWNHPGEPPGPGSGNGGGHPQAPSGRPGGLPQTQLPRMQLPPMQLPPELMPPTTGPVGPTVLDVEPGVGIAAAQLPIAPVTLPVIVAPAIGAGGGGGSPGPPALPVTPRGVTAEPLPGREPLPANVGSNVAVQATSYRIGYTENLRNAGLSQVAALAVPGVTGMLVLTCAGGLLGYRQAKAGHAVHTSGTARFVN
jgi:hypothetical protein